VTSLPLDHPGARIAFDVVVGAFVVSELRIRLRSERNREGSRQDRLSMRVVQVTAVGGVALGVLLTRRAPGVAVTGGPRWPLFVAGLVLMCAGIAVRQWAVATLGRFFTIDVRVQPGQTVVEDGPYRWVRHPNYVAVFVELLALPLVHTAWITAILGSIAHVFVLRARITAEDRVLLANADYVARMGAKPRFIP